jgi:hypothetical protein
MSSTVRMVVPASFSASSRFGVMIVARLMIRR